MSRRDGDGDDAPQQLYGIKNSTNKIMRKATAATTTATLSTSTGTTALYATPSPSASALVDVRYFRNRWVRLVVGTPCTASELLDRLRQEVLLDDLPMGLFAPVVMNPNNISGNNNSTSGSNNSRASTEVKGGRWLAPQDTIKETVLWCCGKPSTVLMCVEGVNDVSTTQV
jgi:hypothetical protein